MMTLYYNTRQQGTDYSSVIELECLVNVILISALFNLKLEYIKKANIDFIQITTFNFTI